MVCFRYILYIRRNTRGFGRPQVKNFKAVAFLKGDKRYVCDDSSPGRSSLSRERGGGDDGARQQKRFWYSRSKGAKVEAWYTSCMEQDSRGGGGRGGGYR